MHQHVHSYTPFLMMPSVLIAPTADSYDTLIDTN